MAMLGDSGGLCAVSKFTKMPDEIILGQKDSGNIVSRLNILRLWVR